MKMIVDREDEIKAFVPGRVLVVRRRASPRRRRRRSSPSCRRSTARRPRSPTRSWPAKIEAALKAGTYVVTEVARKERKQSAAPPFITSTLQRTAYNRFKWPVKRTMQIAQKLYEGKELGPFGFVGLITYMRTDSVRISDDALARSARVYRRRDTATISFPKSRTYIVSRKLHRRRTPTRPSARRRWSSIPRRSRTS